MTLSYFNNQVLFTLAKGSSGPDDSESKPASAKSFSEAIDL